MRHARLLATAGAAVERGLRAGPAGALRLGALALAGSLLAAGDLILEFGVLPPQFLQPRGAIDARPSPGNVSRGASFGLLPGPLPVPSRG